MITSVQEFIPVFSKGEATNISTLMDFMEDSQLEIFFVLDEYHSAELFALLWTYGDNSDRYVEEMKGLTFKLEIGDWDASTTIMFPFDEASLRKTLSDLGDEFESIMEEIKESYSTDRFL